MTDLNFNNFFIRFNTGSYHMHDDMIIMNDFISITLRPRGRIVSYKQIHTKIHNKKQKLSRGRQPRRSKTHKRWGTKQEPPRARGQAMKNVHAMRWHPMRWHPMRWHPCLQDTFVGNGTHRNWIQLTTLGPHNTLMEALKLGNQQNFCHFSFIFCICAVNTST